MAKRSKIKRPIGRPRKNPEAARPSNVRGNNELPAGQGTKKAEDRYELLVIKYFEHDFNRQKAAEACGYSSESVYTSRLFRHPKVVELIKKKQAEMAEQHELSESWVIQRLMAIADASLGDVLIDMGPDADLTKLTKKQRYALSEYKSEIYVDGRGDEARDVKRVSVKLADKLAALEKLGKRLGLFTDKVELNASDDLIKALQAGRARVSGGE